MEDRIISKETEATRGLTLRELVLEIREQLVLLNGRVSKAEQDLESAVTRKELYSVIIGIAGLVAALLTRLG